MVRLMGASTIAASLSMAACKSPEVLGYIPAPEGAQTQEKSECEASNESTDSKTIREGELNPKQKAELEGIMEDPEPMILGRIAAPREPQFDPDKAS